MTPDQTYSPLRNGGHPSREPIEADIVVSPKAAAAQWLVQHNENALLRAELKSAQAKLDTYRRCASMMTDFARKHGNAFMVDGIVDLYAKAMREAGAQ